MHGTAISGARNVLLKDNFHNRVTIDTTGFIKHNDNDTSAAKFGIA